MPYNSTALDECQFFVAGVGRSCNLFNLPRTKNEKTYALCGFLKTKTKESHTSGGVEPLRMGLEIRQCQGVDGQMHRVVHDNHQPHSQERWRILVIASSATVSPRFPLAWRCHEVAHVGDIA